MDKLREGSLHVLFSVEEIKKWGIGRKKLPEPAT